MIPIWFFKAKYVDLGGGMSFIECSCLVYSTKDIHGFFS